MIRVSEIGILIGNLNINSLLNKLERVKDFFMQYIDILVWTVTKPDYTFPTAQFLVTQIETEEELIFLKIFRVNC